MASTITGLTAGNAVTTDQFLKDTFAGNTKTGSNYVLVLLNLSLGALTIDPAAADLNWDDIANAEIATVAGKYTKGTGIALTPAAGTFTTVTARQIVLDFDDASIPFTGAETTDTDAYAIVRNSGSAATSPVIHLGKYAGGMKSPVGVTLSIPIPNGIIGMTRNAAA